MKSKLLILDVDGVMTDGTKAYGPDGKVIFKRFCDHDFTAIKKFKSKGWEVCWLSADKTVNAAVAKDREIDFWYSRDDDGTIDKVKWLAKLIEHYKITEYRHVIYVGDDLFDIPIMKALISNGGSAYCTANAVPQFKMVSGIKFLTKAGGYGAIMNLYNRMHPLDIIPPCH